MTEAMKRLRELRERQSKERQRMAELSREASLTTETRAELDGIEAGTPDLERQIRAATLAVEAEDAASTVRTTDGGEDAAAREKRELRAKVKVVRYLSAAISGRRLDGAEAEYAQAEGVNGIPLAAFDEPERRTETRADAPTPAPGTVGVNLQPIRPAIFAMALAPRLGVEMPRAESGTYADAAISTNMTAGAKTKGADTDSTAAEITVQTTAVKRVSGRMSVRLEDIASIGVENFESSLRANMTAVMSEALDVYALTGDGTAPNPRGLITGLTAPTGDAPASVAAFDDWVDAYADLVDGIWAESVRDVVLAVGLAGYRLAAKTFRHAETETTAANWLEDRTGGFYTHSRLPAPASNVQEGLAVRTRQMVRRAVCPTWGELTVDDIYSGSGKGERYVTLHALVGDVLVLRQDAYRRIRFKTA